jgi:hypothetical protein
VTEHIQAEEETQKPAGGFDEVDHEASTKQATEEKDNDFEDDVALELANDDAENKNEEQRSTFYINETLNETAVTALSDNSDNDIYASPEPNMQEQTTASEEQRIEATPEPINDEPAVVNDEEENKPAALINPFDSGLNDPSSALYAELKKIEEATIKEAPSDKVVADTPQAAKPIAKGLFDDDGDDSDDDFSFLKKPIDADKKSEEKKYIFFMQIPWWTCNCFLTI